MPPIKTDALIISQQSIVQSEYYFSLHVYVILRHITDFLCVRFVSH